MKRIFITGFLFSAIVFFIHSQIVGDFGLAEVIYKIEYEPTEGIFENDILKMTPAINSSNIYPSYIKQTVPTTYYCYANPFYLNLHFLFINNENNNINKIRFNKCHLELNQEEPIDILTIPPISAEVTEHPAYRWPWVDIRKPPLSFYEINSETNYEVVFEKSSDVEFVEEMSVYFVEEIPINFETVNEVFVEYEIEVYFNNTEEPQTIKNGIKFTRKIKKQWRYDNETNIWGIDVEYFNWQEIENLE
jgi:hypothetical protein